MMCPAMSRSFVHPRDKTGQKGIRDPSVPGFCPAWGTLLDLSFVPLCPASFVPLPLPAKDEVQ
jgi:hypothetical protein